MTGNRLTLVISGLIIAAVNSVSPMTPTPVPCVTSCSCTNNEVICVNLGVQMTIPSELTNLLSNHSYQSVTIYGRTKIQSIQARVFTGLSLRSLNLNRLGISSIDPTAFNLLPLVEDISLKANSIIRFDQSIFSFDPSTYRSILNRIDLSSNLIDVIPTGIFGGPIKVIDLSANRIRHIADFAFLNVTSLTSLNLRSNRLTNLSANVFNDIDVQDLTLARNSIAHINPNTFARMSRLQRLDLGENLITSLSGVIFRPALALTYLNLRGNRLTVYSLPSAFVNLKAPIALRIDRNIIDNLANLSVCSSNILLDSLSVTGNRISRIPTSFFTECGSLSTLNLAVNNITGISGSTFAGLSNLVSLNASSNNIDNLPLGSLANFSSLRILSLADNRLTTLDPGIFDNCTNLTTLNLSRNRLSSIQSGMFIKLRKLSDLDLSSNYIYELAADSFSGLSNLRRLDLSGNDITSIQPVIFDFLPVLHDLNLSDNKLTNGSQIALNFSEYSTSELQSLKLNGNDFTFRSFELTLGCNATIQMQDNSIMKLVNMSVTFYCGSSMGGGNVVLSGNRIESITPRAFANSGFVSILDLSSNNLRTIDIDMFAGLSHLRILDLSGNSIGVVRNGSFRSLSQLTELRLGYNKLTVIDAMIFDGLSSLMRLDISDNYLGDQLSLEAAVVSLTRLQVLVADGIGITTVGSRASTWIDRLTKLSLRRNSITRIPGVAGAMLEFLDLGENQLNETFLSQDLPNFKLLQTLKLDCNLIDKVDGNRSFPNSLLDIDLSNNMFTSAGLQSAFQATTSLTKLILDGNQIQSIHGIGLESVKDTLLTFSVVNNQLNDSSWADLTQLHSLQEIVLDGNHFVLIPDLTFRNWFDLQTLSLSRGGLTQLGSLAFDGIGQSCTNMNISRNFISVVHHDALVNLLNLVVLDLSSNFISSLVLPPTLDGLRDLRLDDNRLETFPDGPVQFRSIRSFNVSNNNVLATLPDLEIYNDADSDGIVWTIDLSFTQLNNVGSCSIVGSFIAVNLERSNTHSNGFGGLLRVTMFDRVTHITDLNLNQNNLDDTFFLSNRDLIQRLTTTVSILKLDGNLLTTLRSFQTSTTSMSPCINQLSILRNRINVIEDNFYPSISDSLELLDLRGNRLRSLAESAFASTLKSDNSLITVLLAENPWRCDCSLTWLRSASVRLMIDGAYCLTPQSIAGMYVTCFDVPRNCISNINLNISDSYKGLCSSYININGSQFSYNVSPLFGPVAGGTNVTITGPELNYPSPIVVLYPVDDFLYDVIWLSTLSGFGGPLVAMTPKVKGTPPVQALRNLSVVVIFQGGPTIFTQQLFDFRPNAVVTVASPTDHVITGGTLVTITGTDINCAAAPELQITVVVDRFPDPADPMGSTGKPPVTGHTTTITGRCDSPTATAVTCRMPPVPLPDDFNNHTNMTDSQGPIAEAGRDVFVLTGPNRRDRANIYVGVIFDGLKDYKNFTFALPEVQFRFFPVPEINALNGVIKFNPRQQVAIEVQGKNLQRGVRQNDYSITIGGWSCNVTDLTSTQLQCHPPLIEPPLNDSFSDFPKCREQQLNAVLVNVANKRTFYACIRYVDESVFLGLILGLALGLGIPFVIFVIVVFLVIRHKYMISSDKRDQPSPDYDTQLPGDIELANQVPETSSQNGIVNKGYMALMEEELPGNEFINLDRGARTSYNGDHRVTSAANDAHDARNLTELQRSYPSVVVYELERNTDLPEVCASVSTTSEHAVKLRPTTGIRPGPHPPSLFPTDMT